MHLFIVLGVRRRGEHSFFIIFSKKALFQKWLKTQVWPLFVPCHLHLWTGVPCPQHRRLTPTQAPISQSLDMSGEEQGRGPRCFGLLGEMHEDTWGSRGVLFLWETVTDPVHPQHLSAFPPGNPGVLVWPDFMGYGRYLWGSLSLSPLPGNEGFWEASDGGCCGSWKMRSYLREAGIRTTAVLS